MKSKFKTFIYLAIVLIVVGFVGFILMRFPRFFYFEGSPDGWLSYWGGIFGSVIGVIGALIVLREQINIEKIDNTFFNLLNIHNDIVKSIRKSEAKTSIFDKAYYSIVKNKEKYINEKEYDKIYLFVEFNKNDFIESITLMKESINNLDYNDMVVDYIYGREYFEIQIKEIEEFLSLIHPKLEKSLKCLNWSEALHYINYTYNVVFINDRYSMLTSFFADSFGKFAELYNKMYQQVNFTFDEESKKEVVELSLQEYYGELGSYFRTFHRIIKFVNENVKDIDSKANYIGFLRAMLNECVLQDLSTQYCKEKVHTFAPEIFL